MVSIYHLFIQLRSVYNLKCLTTIHICPHLPRPPVRTGSPRAIIKVGGALWIQHSYLSGKQTALVGFFICVQTSGPVNAPRRP